MYLRHTLSAAVLAGLAAAALADQDTLGIGFPEGYRAWLHHHSTVNLAGHAPEGNTGLQHVYANALAVAGLKTGNYADGAMFVVDIKREHNAVAEARRLKIPVVAIVDTNCDPDLVDFPVAGNDDAIRSVRMILATVGQVITQAQAEYEAKYARRKSTEETPVAQAAPAAPVNEVPAAPAAPAAPSM